MKWLGVLCLLMAFSSAYGQETISLYYYERPPFLIRQADDSAAGLIGSHVTELAAKAGVSIHWQLVPAGRQLHLLRNESVSACGVGWYRTAQRDGFAQFSRPIYRDRGVVVIANARLDRHNYPRLADLLADESLSILLKDGLTYGSAVAALLKPAKARLSLVANEQPQMVRMVAGGRASAMFATREEAEMLLTGGEGGDEGVQLWTFPDLPAAGELRYLMCSKGVGAKTLSKIDAAIGSLAP
jgi:polar amino acid transport system substrate-binding protein